MCIKQCQFVSFEDVTHMQKAKGAKYIKTDSYTDFGPAIDSHVRDFFFFFFFFFFRFVRL